MSSDQICQTLMRQRQGHGDAVWSHPPPAFGQMPEGQQKPIVHPLVMGDGQRDGQVMGAPRAPGEQLHAKLWPGLHAHHQAVVEDGESGRLEHEPAYLRMNM